jgi:TolB protein
MGDVRRPTTVGIASLILAAATACQPASKPKEPFGELPEAVTTAVPLWIPYRVAAGKAHPADPREARLVELRRVTFDEQSGSPRWHASSRRLIVERGTPGCGEIVELDLATGSTTRLSASDELAGSADFVGDRLAYVRSEPAKPSSPCRPTLSSGPPRWTYPESDLWVRGPHAAPARVLVEAKGADAELAGSAHGHAVFTSTRDGDPELYVADPAGKVTRVTRQAGYDGGASISPDGSRIVWHAERPRPAPADTAQLEEAEVQKPGGPAQRPAHLHLHLAGLLGQHPRALGPLGTFDAEPSFLPDSRHLLLTSDYDAAPGAASFELYLLDPDGPQTRGGTLPLERITFHPAYDGQARVSPDGRWIAFTSGRATSKDGGRDVFVARWAAVDD